MKTKKNIKTMFYIGLDVHKKSTAYAVRDKEGNIVLEGKCASKGNDLHEMLEPYLFSSVIGMECNTEVYPIYDYFKDKKCNIKVANTIQLRTLVGKNDKLDAKRLSDMLRLGTFPCAFIPEDDIRSLRSLVNVRHNLLEESTRIKTQIQAIIRRYGLIMPPGDSFTKRWETTLQHHIALNKGGLELRHSYDLYVYTYNKLMQLTNEMTSLAKDKFPKEYEAISERKGIGDTLTPYFISEICPITRFASNKKLRRYAGVIPCSEESADKTYSTKLPKTTSRRRLRWALVEAAQCMSKFDDRMKAYYKKKKKQKKVYGKAIMAVARSISDMLYKLLTECNQAQTV